LDKRIDGYQSIGWTFAAGIVHFIADAAPLDAKEMGIRHGEGHWSNSFCWLAS
jgi:hypothetical protein